jgi:hypothetical protein
MTGWYTHGLANGRALRVKISELATPAAFREAVVEFFEACQSHSAEPRPFVSEEDQRSEGSLAPVALGT